MRAKHPLEEAYTTANDIARAWRQLALTPVTAELTGDEREAFGRLLGKLSDGLRWECLCGRITGPQARRRALGVAAACERLAESINPNREGMP